MKQYTTPEQTAKLIELGFEKPKGVLLYAQSVDCDNNYGWRGEVKYNCDYTIGELVEILPRCIETPYDTAVLEISYDSDDGEWYCGHRWYYNRGWRLFGNDYKTIDDTELVDALYRYIVGLKEDGVI